MADGQRFRNRRNRQSFRPETNRSELGPFGIDNRSEREERVPHPVRNIELLSRHDRLDPRIDDQVSMVATSVEISENTVRIGIPENQYITRENERVPAPDLPTREELAQQELIIDERGSTRIVQGEFPINITTVLVVGDRAAIFEGRGQRDKGLVGPLHQLPGAELISDIAKNYFVIGKPHSGKERKILTPRFSDGSEERQALLAKERVRQSIRGPLSEATQRGANVRSVLSRLSHIDSVHTLQRLSFKEPSQEFKALAQTIEVSIGGKTERISGFVDFDNDTKTITIARPVYIDPAELGIDIDSLEVYDGTGQGRTVRWVSESDVSRNSLLRQMLLGVRKKEHEAAIKEGMTAPKEVKLLRSPYALPPEMHGASQARH